MWTGREGENPDENILLLFFPGDYTAPARGKWGNFSNISFILLYMYAEYLLDLQIFLLKGCNAQLYNTVHDK
jgi:hypothetical protein